MKVGKRIMLTILAMLLFVEAPLSQAKINTNVLGKEKRIREIGMKLLKFYPESLPLEFKYEPSPEVTAYCEGNKIVVSQGLLGLTSSEGELAAIIAHEIGHAINARVIKEFWVSLPSYSSSFCASILLGAEMVGLVMKLTPAPYTEGVEMEADFIGTLLAYQAGYDPPDLYRIFEKLASKSGKRNTPKSSEARPPILQRVAMIKKEIDALRSGQLVPQIVFSIFSRKAVLTPGKYRKEQLISTCRFMGYGIKVDAKGKEEIVKVKAPCGKETWFLILNGKVERKLEDP